MMSCKAPDRLFLNASLAPSPGAKQSTGQTKMRGCLGSISKLPQSHLFIFLGHLGLSHAGALDLLLLRAEHGASSCERVFHAKHQGCWTSCDEQLYLLRTLRGYDWTLLAPTHLLSLGQPTDFGTGVEKVSMAKTHLFKLL